MAILSGYERHLLGLPQVKYTHDLPGKTQWVDHRFTNHVLMLMTGGGGTVRRGEAEWRRAGPFAFLARPGVRYHYGPDRAWDEFGFVFLDEVPDRAFAAFPEEPWEMRAAGQVEGHLAEARRLLEHLAVSGVADQVDLLAWISLAASRFGTGEDLEPGPARQIFAAEAWLRTHLDEDIDLNEVIRRFGFSEPTFRRTWRRYFGATPWQHVIHLRVEESMLLLQTRPELSVAEIAYRCGFKDQRNFATVFRRRAGTTPTAYRRVRT